MSFNWAMKLEALLQFLLFVSSFFDSELNTHYSKYFDANWFNMALIFYTNGKLNQDLGL